MCLIGALVLPFVTDTVLFWPTIFLWGGITFAVYPITLAMLGDRLSGSGLLAGNAVFAMAWGIGGLLGPAATGAAMTAVGPQGLPLTLGLLWAGVLLSLLRRRTIRA